MLLFETPSSRVPLNAPSRSRLTPVRRQLSCLGLTETLRLSEVFTLPEPDRGFRLSGLQFRFIMCGLWFMACSFLFAACPEPAI